MEPTFAERLTDWLKFLGMRQADLARAMEVSKAAVHGWMSGDSAPSTDRIQPIVEALGIRGGVAEFFARMPHTDAAMNAAREAKIAEDEKKRAAKKHPRTRDITRELDASAFQGSLGTDGTCPNCGGSGEAA
jgi:transcriptional regulator with XRE-family HTH domain